MRKLIQRKVAYKTVEKPAMIKHKVAHGLWLELPVVLTPEQAKERIARYLKKVEEKHQMYNPKGKAA